MSTQLNDKILPIIREAGKIILSARGMYDESKVNCKDGAANFVTEYDVQVQDFLIGAIKNAFVDAVFIAEEKENDPSLIYQEHCFIIDPIDGTTNFIRDYGHSCISVAMLSKGEVVFGAVYDPYLEEMFVANKGCGAFLNGKPIKVSSRSMDMAICAYGTAPYYRDVLGQLTFDICQTLFMKCADLRRCGSAALDLAYLAAGRNDIFFECKLSPWDYSAAKLLIEEAGGVISDMDGAPVSFSEPVSVIAANKELYSELLNTVKGLK